MNADSTDTRPACASCGAAAEPFWVLADRPYCRDCVTRAGGAELGQVTHPLVENVQLGCGMAIVTALWSGVFLTAMLSGVIVLMFLVINFFALMARPVPLKDFLVRLGQVLPLFAGFAFAFIGVIGIPTSLFTRQTKSASKVSVSNGEFVVNNRFVAIPLSECVWTTPQLMAADDGGCYLPKTRLIVISSTNLKSPGNYACGFTRETYLIWKTFLTLERIPFKVPGSPKVWCAWVAGGASIGSLLGSLIGFGAALHLGKPDAVVAFGFAGFLDGALWGILRAIVATTSTELLRRSFGDPAKFNWNQAVLVTLTGFGLGFKIGAGIGFTRGLVIALLNGVIGFLLYWNVSRVMADRLQTAQAFPDSDPAGSE